MSSRFAASAAALAAALCAGLWFGGHPSDLPGPVRDAFVDEHVAAFSEAREMIEDNYFREVAPDKLEDSSIGGMVEFLRRRFDDRFSHYFDPKELDLFEEATAGRFSGVGLSVSEVKRGLRVARVFGRSPAARAGIEVGDVIVSVNGGSIAGLDSDLATARIKGPPGTDVTLGVLRPSTGVERRLEIERAQISVPVVLGRVVRAHGQRIGYVEFTSFTTGAHGELRDAIERVEARGARGIVLDLRGNGGGLLREAVLCASIFLPDGEVVVSTDARTRGREVYRALGNPLPPRPLVVLINRDTASAAEILAAALRDQGLATLVGTRSFGKGVFQQVIELPNGGALDLTIGEYFTAEGTSLAGEGIKPDVRAEDRAPTRVDEGLAAAERVLARELRDGA